VSATWSESPQRGTWLAGLPGLVLTATRRQDGRWLPAIIGPDGTTIWRGEPAKRRLAAQLQAEAEAAARR
jgi:hypothetical protein